MQYIAQYLCYNLPEQIWSISFVKLVVNMKKVAKSQKPEYRPSNVRIFTQTAPSFPRHLKNLILIVTL